MDNREKFTNKVGDYVKYRPSYPEELIDYLINQAGLSQNSVIADIGAGTGKLTKLLGDKVSKVFAVEPNLNMRLACEQYCQDFSSIAAIDGDAENTTLSNHSVDFITVAQAFHWFDRQKTKLEFQRILKTRGKVILIWNSKISESEVVKENDELCRRLCPEFGSVSGGRADGQEVYKDFFTNGCEYRVFDNNSLLTLEGYIGVSLSTSYAPLVTNENYEVFIEGLTQIFNRYSCNGKLLLPMKTHCYVGEV